MCQSKDQIAIVGRLSKDFGEILANFSHILPFKIVWPASDSRDPFLLYQADETYTNSSLFDHMEGLQRLRNGTGVCVNDVTKKPGEVCVRDKLCQSAVACVPSSY